MRHTQIKICGLTDPGEAAFVNANQVDFIGNVLFFEKSKRNIDLTTARLIHAELAKNVKKVAVVVSPSADHLLQIEEAGFDYVQIHGEMPEEKLLAKISVPVWKAFNGRELHPEAVNEYGDRIAGFLFDANAPGSGRAADWQRLKELFASHRLPDSKLCFVAGGLNPENVAEVIRMLRPGGVDVSSGVEYAEKKGKDPKAVERFVRAVRRADEESF